MSRHFVGSQGQVCTAQQEKRMDDQMRKHINKTRYKEQETRAREQPHQHQGDPSSSPAWFGSSQQPVQHQALKQTNGDARSSGNSSSCVIT
eukprot:6034639-Amphidinium_carterae.1